LTPVNNRDTIQRMSRPRHPNKHIEAAVQYAEGLGWRFVKSKGHAWGRLFCPEPSRVGCIISVWSTPRKPENHARRIRSEVDLCPHGDTHEEGEEGTRDDEREEHGDED
jgi:hypothetical protein